MTNNQLNQTILTNMLDTKNKIENGALLKKRAFFIQSTNFHGLSMNHILAIHSQNPVATDLRSFDEWKKVKRSITLGEKATFLLTNYSDKQSKRMAMFDISQTTGQNYNVDKTDEKILGESLAILSEQALGDFSTVGDYIHAYVHDFAEKGLRNYDKLTQEEKGYVSVVGEYTLCQTFGLNRQKQQVLTQLEKDLFVNNNVRFIPIIQVGNNMSTTLINSINQVQNLAIEQLKEKEQQRIPVKENPYDIDDKGIIEIDEMPSPTNQKSLNDDTNEVERELSLFDDFSAEETSPTVTSSEYPKKDFSFTTSGDPIYSAGVVKKIEDNIEAIRLSKQITTDNRLATSEEQQVISRYSGWGGVANDLFDTRKDRFQKERRTLQMLMTPDEYRSIEDSSLTSYFTDPSFIEEIWNKLEKAGFSGGRVLDPAMGSGNFFSAMPKTLRDQSELVGVEIDSITGEIAKQLHPSTMVHVKGFEQTMFKNGSFDVVVGNVPFNNLTLSDATYSNMMIHDYFFKKSMDLVREGGILAFITSTGTMDKADIRLRESIAREANLVGGFRLPNNAFRSTANTDVTSDLLFFQKKTKEQMSEQSERPDWVNGAVNDHTPNHYFVNNPDHVLGELFVKNFNGQTLSVKPTTDYRTLFKNSEVSFEYETVPMNTLQPHKVPEQHSSEAEKDLLKDTEAFTYVIDNGQIFYNDNESIKEIAPRNKKSVKRVQGMIELRNEIKELIRIQKIEDYDVTEFQEQLTAVNKLYDNFVQSFGYIHSRENKREFRSDDYYPLLCSAEIQYEDAEGAIHYKKSELFDHATIRPQKTITKVDTALEALQLSVNTKQTIDFEYMKQISGKTMEVLIEELGSEIYLSPETNQYESASEYLSGDVKSKLSTVEQAISEGNDQFEPNRIALKKIIPLDLTLADINYQVGTTWIPQEYYIDFMEETFDMGGYAKNNVFHLELNPHSKEYFISNKSYFHSPLVTKTYGTKDRNAYALFEDLLNFKNTTIMQTIQVDDGNGKLVDKKILDPEATLLCREKQEMLRTEFKTWVESSDIRRTTLETIYNERFNRFVVRKYDGSSLTFGTMNQSIELREHQRNAVQRIVTEGRGLLAHVVGSGKTLSMIASGMKLKELGLAKKPLYLVPKSLIRPFGEEILRAYPDKKVLIATDEDFKKENRKQFISKVATGTYDAIVMGHTQFAKTPLSKERYQEFLENELTELEDMLMSCEEDSHSFKAIKGELKRAEERLEKQLHSMDRDRILDFEDLGVDFIFVDEAHMYKNLGVRTKLGNVAGISTTSANKSLDMLAKIQYIQQENNGRGVVFATGTPISNSMCELYTMNRYLAPDILEELDVTHFDDWQGVFGEVENKLEMTPEASGYRVRSRFSKFHNIPELMVQFSRFADVQTADMLELPTPNLTKVLVDTAATTMQQMKMEELALRSEAIRSGSVSPTKDNMLKITSEARRMALDPRLLEEDMYTREDSNKLAICAENVFELWKKHSDSRAAQIIFSDIGTPSAKKFNVYDELKSLLVEKGIPESEIQFIHDAANDIQKEKLFKDVRTGSVRVLLGSTEKLGTGVNVQNRLIAIHNLDCPWRPSDLEQRLGRIERQGNEFSDVYSYTYITKGTFDSYLFQIQEQKLTYITQIMSSKALTRSTDDVDELVVEASEVKALATGNPLVKERADLENDVRRLTILKSNHYQQNSTMQHEIEQAKKMIPAYEERLMQIEQDIDMYDLHTTHENSFECIINGQTFKDEKKVEIGQAFLDRISEVRATSLDLKEMRQQVIAEMNGFKVHFNGFVLNSSDMNLQVIGEATYHLQIKSDSPLSPMIKLGNFKSELEKAVNRTTTLLTEEQRNLSELKAQVNKPFDRSQELNEKQKRLRLMDEAIELGVDLDELALRKENTQQVNEVQTQMEIETDLSM
ncbi:helicase-related protein [Enterococcus plantarum]|uniref:helicase-related protein n=1 Tax=Enterococcus plantarum TaxID=1077675 RepID=UPI001A8E9B2A|nr:helicase-related protein [Enterococcus plantarum]MBO0422702.1 DEAD/DEAH box helicase family protein [Enterococcus plantarum]